MAQRPPERTALYRFYDAEGRLLYVGIAADPEQRWRNHATQQYWWHTVAHREVQWINGRREALAAEKAAMRSEAPLYNAPWDDEGHKRLAAVDYDPSADRLKIETYLRAEIASGAHPPGTCFHGQRVAKILNVSASTVNSVMWRLGTEKLLERRGMAYGIPRPAVPRKPVDYGYRDADCR